MGTNAELYERDFFTWTQATATLIRQGKWHEIDPERVAEELEGIGLQDKHELAQRLSDLLYQLLTWWAQPEERCGRWRSALCTERRELTLLLRDSPSLQAQVPTFLHEEYPVARAKALTATGLATLPTICPFTPEQVLAADFWPESPTLAQASAPA